MRTNTPPIMPLRVAFYSSTAYHVFYSRTFKNPKNIHELQDEFLDYIVRRLHIIDELRKQVPKVSSVHVYPDEFNKYLATNGLTLGELSETDISKYISRFSTTLTPSREPVVEILQRPSNNSDFHGASGTITRFHSPVPSVPRSLVVGVSLVLKSKTGKIIGRYFAWNDGDFPIAEYVKKLEKFYLARQGKKLKIIHEKKTKPVRFCLCCKLPLVVCSKRI